MGWNGTFIHIEPKRYT